MATLTYSHFGNPSRSYQHAHYRPFLPLTDGRGGHKYSTYVYYVTIVRAIAYLVSPTPRRLVAAH